MCVCVCTHWQATHFRNSKGNGRGVESAGSEQQQPAMNGTYYKNNNMAHSCR